MFLRPFATVIDPGTICLKGGVNLRLYHNSPSLSEDIDFDARIVGVDILKKNVNKILAGRPLLTELASIGITLGEIKPAKQTQTAQRWKFHVIYQDHPLPTRLEFSRRDDEAFEECAAEPPSPSLLAGQRVVPFVFNHYTPPAAYRQKINALATRTQMQGRDVFDLHHLARFAEAGKQSPPALVAQAMDQLGMITPGRPYPKLATAGRLPWLSSQFLTLGYYPIARELSPRSPLTTHPPAAPRAPRGAGSAQSPAPRSIAAPRQSRPAGPR